MLYKVQNKFCMDQMIELCFLSSFMSTPVLLNETLTQLIAEAEENNNGPQNFFQQTHPYYSVKKRLKDLFGSISRGIEPRFSSCSNRIMEGFDDTSTDSSDQKLVGVVRALFKWIKFIDTFQGKKHAADIPIEDLLNKVGETVQAVQNVIGKIKYKDKEGNDMEDLLDFADFRLSVFTTLVSALGIAKPGPHLHQFIFPTVNTAAFTHLKNPRNGQVEFVMTDVNNDMAKDRLNTLDDGMLKGIKFGQVIDPYMREISGMMNWRYYRRDRVEIFLCESRPCRYLNKKDVFKRGQLLFWLSNEGTPMYKKYGPNNCWVPIDLPNRNQFKFL